MALQGTKALEAWCRRVTQDYPRVNILNMTTSWRNGLGFCAIIHHHCPHLIDFDSLDEDDVFRNNELAFCVAEQHLGIPSLLDPQDMVECELLDRLSILTYLSQYFQAFHSQSMQTRVRRLGSMSKSSSANSDISEGSKKQVPTVGRHSDPCRVCSKSVFILERLNVGGRILHRTCFRCARCDTQLSLAGYYETEAGEYCCELCPDEEHDEEKKVGQRTSEVIDQRASEEADSGHSSDDKDIDEEEDDEEEEEEQSLQVAEQVGQEENVEKIDSGSVEKEDQVQDSQESSVIDGSDVKHEYVSVETTAFQPESETSFNESGDLNANVQSHVPLKAGSENNLTDICSGNIDENDNNMNVFKEKNIITTEKVDATSKVVVDVEYPGDKNPFGDEDELELESNTCNTNNATHNISPEIIAGAALQMNSTSDELANDSNVTKQSFNPFGSDFESEEEVQDSHKPTLPVQTSQSEITKPESASNKLSESLNPFGDGFTSDEEYSQGSASPALSVRSRTKLRKKRRAPQPPGSNQTTPRSGLPPSGSSYAQCGQIAVPVPAPRTSLASSARASSRLSTVSLPAAETAKRIKDENNMNRRSQILESIRNDNSARPDVPAALCEANAMQQSDISHSDTVSINQSDTFSLMSASTTTQSSGPSAVGASQSLSPISDKADEGQWRKKKGPAPPRPIPPKRTVKKLHRKAINQELFDIEVKQGELERQGVKLEKSIREICDKNDEEGENRDSLGPEAEDLIIQLFDLVNEKNELFRRQTELIYMKKDNRLEEQHADLEYQIRIIMSKPEGQKSEEEQRREEKLIRKLVEVVGLRNEIVDCLEMDRLRELDEDTAIEDHMSNYAAVKPEETKKSLSKILRIKKKKKKDKDNEKDVDTSELPADDGTMSTEKKKRSAKKKLLKYASKKLTFPH